MRDNLVPVTLKSDVACDDSLPALPVDINQPQLMALVDTVYTNDQQKRQSTIRFVFTYCGGAIIYCSKTQFITTISSTEAEFLAAVSCTRFPYIYDLFYINLVLNAKSQFLSMKTMHPPS